MYKKLELVSGNEVLQTKQFAKWLKKLKDNLAKVTIVRRIE